MKRNYLLFLIDISERIDKIETFTAGMDFETFKEDDKTVSACIREIEVIGEAVKQIPKEVREEFGDLPWSLMAKMRDKLIHWYFDVDEEIVWNVIKERLPGIKTSVDSMVEAIKKRDG